MLKSIREKRIIILLKEITTEIQETVILPDGKYIVNLSVLRHRLLSTQPQPMK